MSIIRTDKWLLDSYDDPIKMCEKLIPYFAGATGYEIYQYLTLHGMYRPSKRGLDQVKSLQEREVWKLVEKERRKLQKDWEGPNVPVFIFPSESNNRKLFRSFNRKSGLAFHDKVFLFVSPDNSGTEIKALLTHEYNHVCRLKHYDKKEQDYVLLDTVILEGLAEHAVYEKYGEDYVAHWASNYSEDKLENMWKNDVYPNRNLAKAERKHKEILFGLTKYPDMLGYSVGYYLIGNYSKSSNLMCRDLLAIESNILAQIEK
ncbi:Zn-dependent protease [Oceanobacillus arenosus]|uniref:Zn-dependent protease n=1 Tax=Oceanobacillus arenosus TaxID=1229153 RepID=A0A3D8PRL2_9BACI|nr:DUF2268 domain-containing protein [Oceanobacillus arenosus]RDW18352.1 Zn-dependent protease [Oceanobacillus arenosus]